MSTLFSFGCHLYGSYVPSRLSVFGPVHDCLFRSYALVEFLIDLDDEVEKEHPMEKVVGASAQSREPGLLQALSDAALRCMDESRWIRSISRLRFMNLKGVPAVSGTGLTSVVEKIQQTREPCVYSVVADKCTLSQMILSIQMNTTCIDRNEREDGRVPEFLFRAVSAHGPSLTAILGR